MSLGLLATLAGLALVDSMSFGTLGVPVVLVVAARRVHARNMAIYFATVCGFYFLVGLAILLGADAIVSSIDLDLEARPILIAQAVIGAAMLIGSFAIDNDRKNETGTPTPRRSWIPSSGSPRAMIAIGLTATLLEVATMVPYLTAIGLMTADDAALGTRIAVLAAYCVVMIVPAIVVIGIASVWGDRLWNRLERFSAWLERTSAETVAWVVGIAGFFILGDAVSRLG
jgi:cytochrome c biogenesis protein CcdA